MTTYKNRSRSGYGSAVYIVTLGALVLLTASCNDSSEPPQGIQGLLVGTNAGVVAQTIADIDSRQFVVSDSLRNLRILCIGQHGLPIIRCDGPLDVELSIREIREGDSLYEFNPSTGELKEFRPIGLPTHHICNRLDYDQRSHRYLFLGRLDSTDGLFILDSCFQVIREIGSLFPVRVGLSNTGPAYFAESGVVTQQVDGIWFLDSLAQSAVLLSEGELKGVAPDRHSVLIDVLSKRSIGLLDLQDKTFNRLFQHWKESGSRYAFSPNGEYLAYTRYEGYPEKSYVYIHDLTLDVVVWKRECYLNNFVWLGK